MPKKKAIPRKKSSHSPTMVLSRTFSIVFVSSFVLVGLVLLSAKLIVVDYFPFSHQVVLGKDDDRSSNSGSGSSGSSDQTRTIVKPTPIQSEPTEIEEEEIENEKDDNEDEVRVKTVEDDNKVKTEIKFSETEKVKTETKDGESRVDVVQGGVKVRYEVKNEQLVIKAEQEDGTEASEQEIVKIKESLDKSTLKIATAGGEITVTNNNVGAHSSMPIQIDLATNQLIVTTPAGTRTLTVLPDQAVINMIAANVIHQLKPSELAEKTQNGEVSSLSQIVELGERDGVPVYEIKGLKTERLLGFIPIQTDVTAVVSAQTGELVTRERSLSATIIDLLSL